MTVLKVPGLQLKQTLKPVTPEKRPGAHKAAEGAEVTQKEPAGQTRQVALEVAPTVVEKRPAVQL